ncbi:MAG: short-chain dehydrogenase [Myxococcales bacterium]|nr:short-chain dehydrogenase [Myxococcales bacterium]|tara:strand:- start:2529 stop:3287 length:759 start_codon:yes stop_codon:yes gene_type:complete
MTDLTRWQGKVALVTGASSGIGAATLQRLFDEGLFVVGAARRQERIAALLKDKDPEGKQHMALGVDLRDVNDIQKMFETVRQQMGGIDVLINCAGLGHDAPLLSGDAEHWREMLDVNVLALCICTQEGIKDMRERGDKGHVIHVSSMSGHRVPGSSGVYSATKFAVRSLTEGLRNELRAANSHIRISAISPAYVETDFVSHYHRSEEKAQEIFARFEVLQPEDIADAIVYMLSCPPHVQVHDLLVRATEQTS